MIRRLFLLSVVATTLFISAAPSRAETGIGVVFGDPGNVGLSLRFDNLSIGAAWGLGDNGYLHVTADWWTLKNNLSTNLDWFLGPGIDLGINDPFFLAVRLPIGLQWMPAKKLEIFGQVSPGLQILNEVDFYIGGSVGIRYIL